MTDLDEAPVCAHGDLVPPLCPADRGHRVVLVGQITEASYLTEETLILEYL